MPFQVRSWVLERAAANTGTLATILAAPRLVVIVLFAYSLPEKSEIRNRFALFCAVTCQGAMKER